MDNPSGQNNSATSSTLADGPWTVVQKQRWQKKGKEKGGPAGNGGRVLPATLNAAPVNGGSRFNILNSNECEVGPIIDRAVGQEEEVVAPAVANIETIPRKKMAGQLANQTGVAHGSHMSKRMENNDNRAPRVIPPAKTLENTRKPFIDKTVGKNGESSMIVTRHLRGNVSSPIMTIVGEKHVQGGTEIMCQDNNGSTKQMELDTIMTSNGGPIGLHPTRPPDPNNSVASYTPSSSRCLDDVGMMESEEFMDAHEQGELIASDSEMEVVIETPHL